MAIRKVRRSTGKSAAAIAKMSRARGRITTSNRYFHELSGTPEFWVKLPGIGKVKFRSQGDGEYRAVDIKRKSGSKSKKAEPITVRIYLDNDDAFTTLKVVQGASAVLEEAGYGKTKIESVEQGSIKLWIRAWLDSDTGQKAQQAGKDKMSEAAGYMEQYAKDVTVNKQRAEISAINSQTARNLMDSLKDSKNGALQMDEWLVVKTTDAKGDDNMSVRKLSVTEMLVLNRSPGILNDPKSVLEKLTLLAYEEENSQLAIEG